VLIESIDFIQNEIYIVIVGEGELSQYILKKAYSHKNVKLLNRFVNEEEKKYLLNKCKFLVFPSTLPSEAFGIIQIEAMAYGKPVINTNLPTGVPWVSLHNISGLTVKPNDKYELANAIKKLYYDDIIYKRLSTGALDRFNNYFTKEKTDNALIDLYFK
jgi:rhamnosyl/mannosyltransferase